MRISVCMATYNGALFVAEQISSILCQLNYDDELIIVDDCSTDNTLEIINELNDVRVKLLCNKSNIGVNHSFSRAIMASSGDYVFLTDQDDVWLKGRVELMLNNLINSNVCLLTSNFSWIDEFGESTFVKFDGVSSTNSKNYFKNVFDIFTGKTNYFGCAMVFSKSLVNYIVPIPSFVESHDLWIAKIGNLIFSQMHLDDTTFLKRIHDNNTTSTVSKRNFLFKLFSRFIFIISIFVIYYRLLINDKNR